jgi:hypothetical protein
MIDIIIQGAALSSIWFWINSLFYKDRQTMRALIWWAKVIIPQGIIIAFALNSIGIL